MDKKSIIADAVRFTNDSPENYVSDEVALSRDIAGMRIFETPIFAFGAADDELYSAYKSPDIVGAHFLSPREWLPTVKTVISFFLPFTVRIKSANAENYQLPSDEWLHGRYEGQQFLEELSVHIQNLLSDDGYISIIPGLDSRYRIGAEADKFTSNWSERHVAFACGLGTFGLSKGIITEKGMCGRLGSILTEMEIPCDVRKYENVYDYCSMCGMCISHCPAEAISLEEGKKHPVCSDYLDKTRKEYKPRYGCGKCQVKVPCESCIPV